MVAVNPFAAGQVQSVAGARVGKRRPLVAGPARSLRGR